MATALGTLPFTTSMNAAPFTNRVSANYKQATMQPSGYGLRVDTPSALKASALVSSVVTPASRPGHAGVNQGLAFVGDMATEGLDWFERFHVIPRSFTLGNVLSTQNLPIEVYSAFRHSIHYWLAFVNNAGTGVTLVGAPALPAAFQPQSGKQMTLQVDSTGTPIVATTLNFLFDSGTTKVPISLQRIVFFPISPELPFDETLEFLTTVFPHTDGTEQRAADRKNPRHIFAWNFVMDVGAERQVLDALLFDWQTKSFGIGMWHELTTTTSASIVGATTFNVGTTDFADYRVGFPVVVQSAEQTFDVLTITAFTTTTITVLTGALNAYAAGATVAPLKVAVINGKYSGRRYPTDAETLSIAFRTKDNDSTTLTPSVAAFSTFNGKVLLDDPNCISEALAEEFQQDGFVMDGETGLTLESSGWPNQKRRTAKTFFARGRQAVWNVRRLFLALRGKQVSFYLPTFGSDVTPVSNVALGSALLDITLIGYTQFVRNRQPKNVLRITFADGSTPIYRTIISSAITGATKETLTLNANWPANFTIAQLGRISFVEKVRCDSDSITISHSPGERTARITTPVVAVLE